MKYLKNCMLILVVMFFCSSTIVAQTIGKKIYYGFTYGVSANSVFNHVTKTRLGVGLSPVLFSHFVQFKLDESQSIIAELDYVHKEPSGYTIDYLTISGLFSKKLMEEYPNVTFLGGLYTGHIFKYKFGGMVFEPEPLKKYDLGVEVGVDYTRPLNEKLDLYVSPRVEIGVVRF